MSKTWKDYPIKKDSNNNYYIAYIYNNQYISDYHVIPNDAMGVFDYAEVDTFYNSLTGNEQVYDRTDTLVTQKQVYTPPSIPLSELKKYKLQEINSRTEAKIVGGFTFTVDTVSVTFDSDKETQLTVSSDLAAINAAPEKFSELYPEGYALRGYSTSEDAAAKTNKTVYYLTHDELIQWNLALSTHRSACKHEGWVKQTAVEAAQSKEELDAISLT